MMNRWGLALVFAGALGLLASAVLFGSLIWDAMVHHVVFRQPLPLGAEFRTTAFGVETDQLCRVGVRARIEAEAERRTPSDFGAEDGDYVLKYRYPFRFEVFGDGSAERPLFESTTALDGRSYSVSNARDYVRRTGGWIHGTFWFEKFSVPPETKSLVVHARLDADPENETSIEQIELIVVDDAKPIGLRLTWAIVSLVLGLLAIVGGGVWIALRSPGRTTRPSVE